jgi:signal transduction histidine kinase/CheY-like chemotaxis protein
MDIDALAPSLATFPAGRRQAAAALGVGFVLVVVLLAAAPLGAVMLQPNSAMGPSFFAFLTTVNVLTALLLWRDAALARSLRLAILAAAYLCAAIGAVPYALQLGWSTTVWTAGLIGFPVLSLCYALAYERPPNSPRQKRRWLVLAVLGLLIASIVTACVRSEYDLAPVAVDAAGIAVLLLRSRPLTVAPLWLAVALAAHASAVILANFFPVRYTAGWYAGGICGMLTASILLIAFMIQTGTLIDAMQYGRRRLRSVVDGVGDVLLAVDGRGRIEYANPAAERIFGIRAHDLRGRIAGEVVAESPVPLELGAGDHVLIGRDVSARRRADAARDEALAAANEAADVKARFLATMSHELRTPINAVVGMSELMLQTPLTDEARDYAHTVRSSAEALLDIINDVLDFSKIEAGATEIERAPFSPLSAVENAADILATTARTKGIALATYVAPDVPRWALGDAHRVRQVLLNLISNALKFTERGYVTVRAVVERNITPEIAGVRFTVVDTGAGISVESAERLFQPFRQAEVGTTRRYGGTGLGLSIAKRLVELMGGEIGLESVVGRGSTFWFTLPLERIEDDAATVEEERGVRGARVLVIDDEPTSRGVVEQYLLAWGAVATGTANAAHAHELARAAARRGAPHDVLVVAHGLALDAFATLARLRASGVAAPALFVSGRDESGQGEEAMSRGFAGYLRKPLKQSVLHDGLADALAGRVMRLPLHPSQPARAAVRDDVAILIADDNPVNRKLTLQQLAKLGYRADAVADGAEAVNAVAGTAYDIVLMDCEMPELDGFGATRAIRAAERATGAHVKIIAMTANALAGDRERCIAAGMDDYLAKPVQLAELRGALERYAGSVV